MERILFIIGQMSVGGAETFVMKMYRSINKKNYQFDFVLSQDGYYCDEIRKMGGIIYYTTPKSRNLIKSMRQIKNIVKTNNYRSVVRFGTSNAAFFDLLAAKKGGAIHLGVRTLSANQGNLFKKIVSFILRPLLNSIATVKFAPSIKAADATYGKKAKKIVILKNGINFNDYSFRKNKRFFIRHSLKIHDDTVVIGHVGRLNEAKNHKFLFKVFSEYHKINPNSVLICVGDGPLLTELKNMIASYDLNNSILLLGERTDVSELYSAFDIFMFPSLYEGMPNSLIEAQANGLPCLYSDQITKECELSKRTFRLQLNWEKWVEKCRVIPLERTNNFKIFKKNGYLIEESVQLFVTKITDSKY